MAEERIEAAPVRDIIGGGSVSGGEYVFFTLQFDDLSQHTSAAPFALMPRLVANLLQYAGMAEQDRAKTKGGHAQDVSPYRVTKLISSRRTDDGGLVGLKLGTADGFPLDIAMSPEQAAEAIALLQSELDKLGWKPEAGGG